MSIEYSIYLSSIDKIKEAFEIVFRSLKSVKLTSGVTIKNDQITIENDSSWGKWMELSMTSDGLYYWVNANRDEQDLIYQIITNALKEGKIDFEVEEE